MHTHDPSSKGLGGKGVHAGGIASQLLATIQQVEVADEPTGAECLSANRRQSWR
jgi:hypothetical protein